jgi:tetratricopeptide (TPR) repeat protein
VGPLYRGVIGASRHVDSGYTVGVPAWSIMSVVPVKMSDDIERMERKLTTAMGAVPRDSKAAIAALTEAIALARSSPEAAEWFVPAELLSELADEFDAAGRTDEAIAAMVEAISEGYSGRPDGRCRLAGIFMHAGQWASAEALWADVKADTPDDVWLYHSAAVEYAALRDHETALRWVTQGLKLALRLDDPDGLAGQLLDLRGDCLVALGREFDDLQDRAETFVLTATSAVRAGRAPALANAPVSPAPGGTRGAVHAAARWSWFPASEYARALRLWPELTDEGSPAARGCDHATYCRRTQDRIREGAGELMVGVAIAPIRIDDYLTWCGRTGEDPAHARATYAAALPVEHLVAWPPGRNDACWCGSGRKYKRCCGQPG